MCDYKCLTATLYNMSTFFHIMLVTQMICRNNDNVTACFIVVLTKQHIIAIFYFFFAFCENILYIHLLTVTIQNIISIVFLCSTNKLYIWTKESKESNKKNKRRQTKTDTSASNRHICVIYRDQSPQTAIITSICFCFILPKIIEYKLEFRWLYKTTIIANNEKETELRKKLFQTKRRLIVLRFLSVFRFFLFLIQEMYIHAILIRFFCKMMLVNCKNEKSSKKTKAKQTTIKQYLVVENRKLQLNSERVDTEISQLRTINV